MCFHLQLYPIKAENGHPTMAPAATPIIANGVESWNHPVMATSVVYIQKEEGRNAEEKEQNWKIITHKYPKRNIIFYDTLLTEQSFVLSTFILLLSSSEEWTCISGMYPKYKMLPVKHTAQLDKRFCFTFLFSVAIWELRRWSWEKRWIVHGKHQRGFYGNVRGQQCIRVIQQSEDII